MKPYNSPDFKSDESVSRSNTMPQDHSQNLYRILYHNSMHRKLPEVNSSHNPLESTTKTRARTTTITNPMSTDKVTYHTNFAKFDADNDKIQSSKSKIASMVRNIQSQSPAKRCLPALPPKMETNLNPENNENGIANINLENPTSANSVELSYNHNDEGERKYGGRKKGEVEEKEVEEEDEEEEEEEEESCSSNPRASVIPKMEVNNQYSSLNIYQILHHFQLHPIIFSDNLQNCINFHSQLLDLTKLLILPRTPQGPRASNIGSRGNTAFTVVNSNNISAASLTNQSNHNQMTVVTATSLPSNSTNNTKKHPLITNELVVFIENEFVADKTVEYINHRVSRDGNNYRRIVIARSRPVDDKEQKDAKIKQLKIELESLSRKYSDLHNRTLDNDSVIKQLNSLLKRQRRQVVMSSDGSDRKRTMNLHGY